MTFSHLIKYMFSALFGVGAHAVLLHIVPSPLTAFMLSITLISFCFWAIKPLMNGYIPYTTLLVPIMLVMGGIYTSVDAILFMIFWPLLAWMAMSFYYFLAPLYSDNLLKRIVMNADLEKATFLVKNTQGCDAHAKKRALAALAELEKMKPLESFNFLSSRRNNYALCVIGACVFYTQTGFIPTSHKHRCQLIDKLCLVYKAY